MSDQMRAEFEAWAKANDLPIAVLYSGENSGYVDMRTAWAFEGWRVGQKAEQAEVERLRAELAKAKAASACPVKVSSIWEGTYQSDRYIELRTDAEADTFTDWLRERMKDKSPPQA